MFLLTACANIQAPKDIGVGQFAQMASTSGYLVSQIRYSTPFGCEMDVRNSWGSLEGKDATMRCSDDDKSDSLPYIVRVENPPNDMYMTEARFPTPSLCERGYKLFSDQHPSVRFVSQCK